MQGKSFKPLLEGQDIPWRKAAYMENNFAMFQFVPLENAGNNKQIRHTEHGSMRCRGLRSHNWKYISYFDQRPVREELYDLERDPRELKNLAGNPEFSAVLKELRAQCLSQYKSVVKPDTAVDTK
jgi:arylsulfatase A-like enzyme